MFSQNSQLDGGQFPFRSYGPKDYQAHQEILAVLEDDDGFLLMANPHGVLVFNGSKWNIIPLSKNGALWLSKDKEGTVYVGGEDDFGYLKKTSNTSNYSYHSLATLLPDSIKGYGSIWEVESTNYGTYFRSSRYLFWYHNDKLDVLPFEKYPGGTYDVISSVNDTLYLRKRDLGIVKIVGDKLELVQNGSFFQNLKTNAILKVNGELIVATRANGLMPVSPNAKFSISAELNSQLSNGQIYHATTKNGWIAIATLTDGVFLLNDHGELIDQINEDKYGINAAAQFVYFDHLHALWIGTLNGAVRMPIQKSIRIHHSVQRSDLIPYDFERFNDELFVGTHDGLYQISNNEFSKARKILGINSAIYQMSVLDNYLITNGFGGTYLIDNKLKAESIAAVGELHSLREEPLYVSNYQEGLNIYRRYGEKNFELIKKLQVPNNMQSVLEFAPNEIWAGSTSGGLTYYNLATDSSLTYPELGNTRIVQVEDTPYFVSTLGVYTFINGGLEKASLVYDHIDSSQYKVSALNADKKGNLVLLYQDNQFNVFGLFLKRNKEGYEEKSLPDLGITTSDFTTTFLEENGKFWIADNERIFELDLFADEKKDPFSILITGIYAGNEILDQSSKKQILPFEKNQLRFEFGSLFLGTLGDNKYQYFLEGLDKKWSPWSTETDVNYTYLPPGKYKMLVRGKNQYHVLSEILEFEFEIHPPWYWSKLAILLYFVGFIGSIIGITQLRFATLRRDKAHLIKMVRESTEEILEKNKKLKEMDKMKNQFYSNISHEFRTPLTLILGPLQNLSEADEKPTKQEYESMIRNASRLLDLINEMLDLSKLEAKRMTLNATNHNLTDYMTKVHSSFESMAKVKNLQFDLKLNHSIENLPMDIVHMDKILFNLLSNAFKFTVEGGRVHLHTFENDTHVGISITDSGIGIRQDDIDHIFDRFYQAHQETSNTSPGTGIGLSLVKELVKLHGGEIYVSSILNEGSTFTITLPKPKN